MLLNRKTFVGLALIAFVLVPIVVFSGDKVDYTYDDAGRLIQAEHGDGTVIEYYYDEVGNRKEKVISIFVPVISVSPASHDFGNIDAGSSSAPQTFTISNTGNADLVIGSLSLTGTDVTEFPLQNDTCSEQTIASSASCTVEAIFSPATGGAKSADLSIPSNDPENPKVNVSLSGTGVLPVLTVLKDGTGTGTVTSVPTGIDCGTDCTEPYVSGTEVILTSIPDENSSFSGWSGGYCTGTGDCTVIMNVDTKVTATFERMPLQITSSALPPAIINIPYSETLEVIGGVPPYEWAVSSGFLPDGLALNIETGEISGTPTIAGIFDIVVQVMDSESETATAPLSLTIGSTYYMRTESECKGKLYKSGLRYAVLGTRGDCTLEDTIEWRFSGGPEDMLIGYLASNGYAQEMLIEGMSTENNLSFLARDSDGTGYVHLIEADPADGTVIQVLSTISIPLSANTVAYVTDISGLSGTVSAGNTFGIMLSMATTSESLNEVRWGRTGGGPEYEQWISVSESTTEVTNQPPVAEANGPYSGTEKDTITFSSEGSSDPDGDAITCVWDFGDGKKTASGVTVTHKYNKAGTYTVTLTVSDTKDARSTDTAIVTIGEKEKKKDKGDK